MAKETHWQHPYKERSFRLDTRAEVMGTGICNGAVSPKRSSRSSSIITVELLDAFRHSELVNVCLWGEF